MPGSPPTVLYVKRFVRLQWLAAALSAFSLASAATAELPANLRHLAGLAASLPPEFQADALLQIVESRGGLEPALKKDLIEQAAALARQARSPYPKIAVRGINGDSRQAFEASSFALRLDQLSLEMRSVRDMLAFDPIGARIVFQQVPKPSPPIGSCSDALIPQMDDYYDMGAQVASRGFTAKEIDREEHLALLLQTLGGLNAAYEIGPAARMIVAARLTPQQFQTALNALTVRLETASIDSRAFSETAVATQQEIATLAAHAASLKFSRTALARAYRKYLTAGYTSARCADSSAANIINPAEWFNQSDLRGDLPGIELKELKFKDSAGKLRLDVFWSTPDSQKILDAAQGLRTSPAGVAYSLQERASTEWNQKLQSFLEQLTDWKQSGEESELDFFNQKATVYESLIDVCPAGDSRQRLINAFVDFLSHSNTNPVDWFWHVQNMYRRMGQSGDTDAAKLMGAYKASGNLMLEVYVQLNGR